MTSLHGFASNPPPIKVRPPTPDFLHTTLEDGATSFVPPVRGIYEVVLGDQPPIDVQRVAVDAVMPFQPLAWFTTAAIPLDIAVGEMNGDGVDDLVLLIPQSTSVATIEVVFGAEVGGYSTQDRELVATDQIVLGYQVLDVQLGDFQRTGRTDIAVKRAGTDGGMALFGQRPDGSFSDATRVALGYGTVGVFSPLVQGDFNGDGAADIAAPGTLERQRVIALLFGHPR